MDFVGLPKDLNKQMESAAQKIKKYAPSIANSKAKKELDSLHKHLAKLRSIFRGNPAVKTQLGNVAANLGLPADFVAALNRLQFSSATKPLQDATNTRYFVYEDLLSLCWNLSSHSARFANQLVQHSIAPIIIANLSITSPLSDYKTATSSPHSLSPPITPPCDDVSYVARIDSDERCFYIVLASVSILNNLLRHNYSALLASSNADIRLSFSQKSLRVALMMLSRGTSDDVIITTSYRQSKQQQLIAPSASATNKNNKDLLRLISTFCLLALIPDCGNDDDDEDDAIKKEARVEHKHNVTQLSESVARILEFFLECLQRSLDSAAATTSSSSSVTSSPPVTSSRMYLGVTTLELLQHLRIISSRNDRICDALCGDVITTSPPGGGGADELRNSASPPPPPPLLLRVFWPLVQRMLSEASNGDLSCAELAVLLSIVWSLSFHRPQFTSKIAESGCDAIIRRFAQQQRQRQEQRQRGGGGGGGRGLRDEMEKEEEDVEALIGSASQGILAQLDPQNKLYIRPVSLEERLRRTHEKEGEEQRGAGKDKRQADEKSEREEVFPQSAGEVVVSGEAAAATKSDATFDVFLSYCWRDSQLIRQIESAMKRRNLRVWVDRDQMGGGGSTLEAMASGIQSSSMVVIGASAGYQASVNCQHEAEYSFQLKKPLIPLMLADNFQPTGWLGIIMGTKLYYKLVLPPPLPPPPPPPPYSSDDTQRQRNDGEADDDDNNKQFQETVTKLLEEILRKISSEKR